jgi:hypothetical protein
VLGLKINLGKSGLVPVGNIQNVEDLANILGSKVSNVHLKYFNLPLGSTFKAKTIRNFVLEK